MKGLRVEDIYLEASPRPLCRICQHRIRQVAPDTTVAITSSCSTPPTALSRPPAMLSNAHLLTHSHAIIKAKARAKKAQIDQIVFDDDARRCAIFRSIKFQPRAGPSVYSSPFPREYLTGFRKRNLLKKEAAKTRAKQRERQERLQARREQRHALKQRASENAKVVEEAFRTRGKS